MWDGYHCVHYSPLMYYRQVESKHNIHDQEHYLYHPEHVQDSKQFIHEQEHYLYHPEHVQDSQHYINEQEHYL